MELFISETLAEVLAVALAVDGMTEAPPFSLARDTVSTPPTTRMAPTIRRRLSGVWAAWK